MLKLRKLVGFAIIGMFMVLLGACGAGNNQGIGTLLGATIGGIAGAQVGGGDGRLIAVGIGTLLGAMVGGDIGRSMDRADALYAERTMQATLELSRSGATTTWHGNNIQGTVTPRQVYYSGGTPCREFQTTITVGGNTERGYGNACRQSDGTWRIQ